eukprot:9477442-Pyramimonas_sp.AAC.1
MSHKSARYLPTGLSRQSGDGVLHKWEITAPCYPLYAGSTRLVTLTTIPSPCPCRQSSPCYSHYHPLPLSMQACYRTTGVKFLSMYRDLYTTTLRAKGMPMHDSRRRNLTSGWGRNMPRASVFIHKGTPSLRLL